MEAGREVHRGEGREASGQVHVLQRGVEGLSWADPSVGLGAVGHREEASSVLPREVREGMVDPVERAQGRAWEGERPSLLLRSRLLRSRSQNRR